MNGVRDQKNRLENRWPLARKLLLHAAQEGQQPGDNRPPEAASVISRLPWRSGGAGCGAALWPHIARASSAPAPPADAAPSRRLWGRPAPRLKTSSAGGSDAPLCLR